MTKQYHQTKIERNREAARLRRLGHRVRCFVTEYTDHRGTIKVYALEVGDLR